MSNEYKQCPNGHYYQGAQCPYCKTSNNAGSSTSAKTEMYGSGGGQEPINSTQGYGSTEVMPGGVGSINTTMVDNTVVVNKPQRPNTHTVFGDEDETSFASSSGNPGVAQGGYRTTRKLVGWLVSYSLDALGVDFKLYEGRNIIGRDAECNISVNDNMISGKHAVILFRADKYSISDSQSSHGTFVNDEDIELEPRYLKDGDVIRMGKTLFKFRSSL